MSWWVAGVAVAGAGAKFMGSQSASKDMKEAARDSMLTARYNINQRKLEDRQTQFGILEQGHQAASNIQRSANQAVGSATVAAGGSGAIVGEGTPRAVLTNIAQEGLHAQMGAILNTKNAIKAQARQTEANNKTEWNQASAYAKGMERDAKRTMDSARLNFAADVASAVAGGYASSLTAASTTGKVVKGVQTAGQVSKGAQHLRGSGPKAKSKPYTTGYSDMQKTKRTGGAESSRWQDRIGVMPESSQQWYKKRQKTITGGYNMDKVRPTGGSQSSKLFERGVAKYKHSSFDPSGLFSTDRIKHAFGFTQGRVNLGKAGRAYNFLSGKGFKGTAASKKYKY